MWILIVLCIVQLSISLFWACQKNYLFFDEVFSFQAANTAREERVEFLENEWMDESWYTSFMSVDEKDTFDYSIPFNNQIADVHPPLYYLFLHTVCSLFPGEVSFLMGMSVNILFFLGSTIAIYFLSKEILDRKDSALLAAVLYGVSYGGLNTMVYIRMYMLLTLMTLLHALVYMKHMEKQEVSWKGYGLLLITLVGGALSQYYFLFIAFFFGIWYSIKFFVEKRFKELGKYLATVFASAAISLLIWPSMISHMFGGSRGEEATGNLLSFDGYFLGLKEMFRILNNDLFTKLLPVILVGILVLFLICLKKGERFQVRQWNKAWVLLFVCVGYFLLVTKVAPYQVDRYVMPIYPFVMILVVGAAYTLFRKLIPAKFAIALCMIGFGGLSVVHMVVSGIPYTYAKNQDNIERWGIVEEYRDSYALYISDDKGAHYYDAVQMLKEYKGFYYVCDLGNVSETIEDMAMVKGNKIVVYVKNTRTTEEADLFVQKVFSGQRIGEENLLDKDEKWSVYTIESR